jgi:MFS transporter, OPA family, sugar phosphate sensor protein UhpC
MNIKIDKNTRLAKLTEPHHRTSTRMSPFNQPAFPSQEELLLSPPVSSERTSSVGRPQRTPAGGSSLLTATAWKTFLAATLGYSLFYVCRMSLSVVKGPLISEGIFTEFQIGVIGSALLYSYALGKLVNGFLADRVDIRKFAAWGLFISAAINLLLGFHVGFFLFFTLWLVNGWVQSMGAPSFIIGLTRWFSAEVRGTYYGLWSSSHNIGEALTFVMTGAVVGSFGWRKGWWLSAAIGFVGVLIIWFFFRDKPGRSEEQAAVAATDPAQERREAKVAHSRLLRNPLVWLISLASMFMYISRYSVNSWGIFFLENAKGYSIEEASLIISVASIFGIVGTVSSGWLSDKFFAGERFAPTVLAGLVNALSLTIFVLTPHILSLDLACMVGFGVTIGALLCYLGGLIAVDIADKHATGAALGIVGMASNAGAGTQDIFSGYLIGANKYVVHGVSSYNFLPMGIFWITSAVLSVLISAIAWRYRERKRF